MWNSIRRFWELGLLAVVVAVVVVGTVRWDWHVDTWAWLGAANDEESNSTTFRNFGLIFMSIVAIWLTWRRIKIAAREAQTSRQNLQTARDALNLNRETLEYNSNRDNEDRRLNQYARASERLGSDGMSARLGAIYELRDLSEQDLEQFHVRTMRMLCAFVRFPPAEADDKVHSAEDLCSRPLRPDVQAAMEVIGGRTEQHLELETEADYKPDLRQANLVRAQLRDANLSRADLGASRLWGASLWSVDLSGSHLSYTDFSSPWIVQGDELPEVKRTEGIPIKEFNAVHAAMTSLALVDFSKSTLFSASLRGAELQHVDFSDANLTEANLRLTSILLSDLSRARLMNADLTDALLPGTRLRKASFWDTDISGTDFIGTMRGDGFTDPPTGLTQSQLDGSCADPDNPPKLDLRSGLVWNDRPCNR